MRSRNVCNLSSLMGLAVGMGAGLAAGILAAPLRGSAMRATLRERAAEGSTRLQHLFEEGRRALATRLGSTPPEPLKATIGEIASMHGGSSTSFGVTS